MQSVLSERPRIIAHSAVWCLANLTVLMLVALTWADRYDPSNSATPVEDGALIALVAVAALLLLNGVVMCLSPRTRRLGLGVLLGTVLAVPVGLLIIIGFLSMHLA
jgi:hypothetical protein